MSVARPEVSSPFVAPTLILSPRPPSCAPRPGSGLNASNARKSDAASAVREIGYFHMLLLPCSNLRITASASDHGLTTVGGKALIDPLPEFATISPIATPAPANAAPI